jgi:hypothetical protein
MADHENVGVDHDGTGRRTAARVWQGLTHPAADTIPYTRRAKQIPLRQPTATPTAAPRGELSAFASDVFFFRQADAFLLRR